MIIERKLLACGRSKLTVCVTGTVDTDEMVNVHLHAADTLFGLTVTTAMLSGSRNLTPQRAGNVYHGFNFQSAEVFHYAS